MILLIRRVKEFINSERTKNKVFKIAVFSLFSLSVYRIIHFKELPGTKGGQQRMLEG